MIGACLLVLAQVDAARATLARIEISGPCAGLSVELEGAGSFALDLDQPLAPGERRTFSLAVPLPAVALPIKLWSRVVEKALEATSHAKLIELEPALEWSGLSSELLARPRPVLAASGARLPWSALFVLGAALAITLSHRRRILVVTGIALFAGASVFALARGLGAGAISAARILEARFDQAPGEAFLAVEARRGKIELAELGRSRIEVTPPRSLVHCRTSAAGTHFVLDAATATFVQLRAVDPGARRLSREVNAFGRFDEVWLREASGPWRYLGAWNLGDPLPEGRPGEPPGWLVPALPMGSTIFLGRLAEGQFSQA